MLVFLFAQVLQAQDRFAWSNPGNPAQPFLSVVGGGTYVTFPAPVTDFCFDAVTGDFFVQTTGSGGFGTLYRYTAASGYATRTSSGFGFPQGSQIARYGNHFAWSNPGNPAQPFLSVVGGGTYVTFPAPVTDFCFDAVTGDFFVQTTGSGGFGTLYRYTAASGYATRTSSGFGFPQGSQIARFSNRQPRTTTSLPAEATVSVGDTLAGTIVGTDPDGSSLTLSATGLPPFVELTPAAGAVSASPFEVTFSATPTANDYDTSHEITIAFADGSGAKGEFSFVLNVPPNSPPTVEPLDATAIECVDGDHHVVLQTTVDDADGESLSVTWKVDGEVVETENAEPGATMSSPPTTNMACMTSSSKSATASKRRARRRPSPCRTPRRPSSSSRTT